MLENAHEPRLITLSVHVYRRLVAAYPAEFRRDYEAHMAQLFRDCCRLAYHNGGTLALLNLWARTSLDYFKTIVEEYTTGGVQMTREKFIKLSGWALVLGPFLFLIGWLASSRPEYSQYNAASLPIDRFANQAGMPLAVLGQVLISLGLFGMLLRYGSKAGGASFWFGLGAVSGLVSAVGAVGSEFSDRAPWWYLFFFGMVLQFLALAVFGLINLRLRLLPRWNGLPLLAGVWLPGLLLLGGLYQLTTGTPLDSPETVFALLWFFSVMMFAGLGYLLQSDSARLNAANV